MVVTWVADVVVFVGVDVQGDGASLSPHSASDLTADVRGFP